MEKKTSLYLCDCDKKFKVRLKKNSCSDSHSCIQYDHAESFIHIACHKHTTMNNGQRTAITMHLNLTVIYDLVNQYTQSLRCSNESNKTLSTRVQRLFRQRYSVSHLSNTNNSTSHSVGPHLFFTFSFFGRKYVRKKKR